MISKGGGVYDFHVIYTVDRPLKQSLFQGTEPGKFQIRGCQRACTSRGIEVQLHQFQSFLTHGHLKEEFLLSKKPQKLKF